MNANNETSLCDRVGQSVRGLTNSDGDVVPHLSSEVASCLHQIHADDLTDDVVERKLIESKTANWCRTARLLIPLSTNGKFYCCEEIKLQLVII